MLRKHFGQAEDREIHLVFLQPFLELDTAVGARRNQCIDLEFVELFFLAVERGDLELVRVLIRTDAATGATTPVHHAMVFHLDEVAGNHFQQIARLLDNTAPADKLAGIMKGHARIVDAFGLQQSLLAQFVKHLEDMLHLEVERSSDEIGAFPADRRIGVTALGADDRLDLEFFGRIHNTLYEHARDITGADLDASIGRLERLGGNRPALAGLLHDFGNGLQVLGIVHDFHG
mgnify:CR=1 FL=1